MSSDSTSDAIRKRVCKACDRCRMKKSKCDGASPCSRCRIDNAICVFGERKKSHDKVYPKGYVEMLEQQQSQLVAGLQEMYRRSLSGQSWSGPGLSEASGHPLTHDILAALHLLERKDDESGDFETFEEDCQKLQNRLVASGAPFVHRRSSFSSDSDHSQRHLPSPKHSRATSLSATLGNPNRAPSLVRDHSHATSVNSNTSFGLTPSPSPLTQSPIPQSQKLFPLVTSQIISTPSPLSANVDPTFYQSAWAPPPLPADLSQEALFQSKYAMQRLQPMQMDNSHLQPTQILQDDFLPGQMADFLEGWDDTPMDLSNFGAYNVPFGTATGALDPMELDLSRTPAMVT